MRTVLGGLAQSNRGRRGAARSCGTPARGDDHGSGVGRAALVNDRSAPGHRHLHGASGGSREPVTRAQYGRRCGDAPGWVGRGPNHGVDSVHFEPNDPLGPAWRRDETIEVSLRGLPPPWEIFAQAETSTQFWSASVTSRCDAGDCWRTTLPLDQVRFPAFRGNVLVWATASDGGLQTRPRVVPVTRWHWRRTVAGVANPVRVTQPMIAEEGTPRNLIVVGTEDTRRTGRLRLFSAGGATRAWQWDSSTDAVLAVVSSVGNFAPWTALMRRDGGTVLERLDFPEQFWFSSEEVSLAGVQRDQQVAASESELFFRPRIENYVQAPTMPLPPGCSRDAGFSALTGAGRFFLLFPTAGPLCVVDSTTATGLPPNPEFNSQRSYLPVFSVNSPRAVIRVAGADGGLWTIPFWGTPVNFPEENFWDGGTVDGIVEFERTAFWVTADREIWTAPLAPQGPATRFAFRLPSRAKVNPVLLPTHEQFSVEQGTIVVVDEASSVHAISTERGTREWWVSGGDGGIRGGRVDTSPISVPRCAGLDAVLIPSSGDGSLYSFITDERSLNRDERGFPLYRSKGWLMRGGDQSGTHQRGSSSVVDCVEE